MFLTRDALGEGATPGELAWGERTGRWRRVRRGVYGLGPEPASLLDRLVADVLAADGVACGQLAGVLHGWDGVRLGGRPVRRRLLPADRITVVDDIRCTDGLQTIIDLAAVLDDLRWEQALESGLRKGRFSVPELEAVLPTLGASRVPGTNRIRRALDLRPPGAAPTGSILETMMVQLARGVDGLGDPVRQCCIERHGIVIAKLDLAWPEIGLFLELDGQQHKGQPVYDASRETLVVATTGWLCGRFAWTEVVHLSTSTTRRLGQLAEAARRRPLVSRSVR